MEISPPQKSVYFKEILKIVPFILLGPGNQFQINTKKPNVQEYHQ